MNAYEQKQVNTLCRWVTVKLAPSEIEGVGMFAIKDMPTGTKLYADIMPQIFKLPIKVLENNSPEYVYETILSQFPRVVIGDPFTYPNARFVAYCNHSDDPNYDAKTDQLLRAVKKGEEITEDYRQIVGWEQVFPFLID